jgi:hypothetical protein
VKQSVLVRVVESVEQSHEGRVLWVRAVVRLRPLNRCPHRLTQRRNDPLGVMKLSSITSDREGKFIGIPGQVGALLVNGDGEDQVVESAAHVMNTITQEQGPLGAWKIQLWRVPSASTSLVTL